MKQKHEVLPRNRNPGVPDSKQAESAQKKNVIGKISSALDISPGAAFGMPQIELVGNREAVVEGCQGILEYDDNVIKLSIGKMAMQFTGRNLHLKCMSDSTVVIVGYFLSIEFIG